MKICIYAEPLKEYTSSNPMRDREKKIILQRGSDTLILLFRDKLVAFKEYFEKLHLYSNLEYKCLIF